MRYKSTRPRLRPPECNRRVPIGSPEAQAIFCRRRHQLRRPPLVRAIPRQRWGRELREARRWLHQKAAMLYTQIPKTLPAKSWFLGVETEGG